MRVACMLHAQPPIGDPDAQVEFTQITNKTSASAPVAAASEAAADGNSGEASLARARSPVVRLLLHTCAAAACSPAAAANGLFGVAIGFHNCGSGLLCLCCALIRHPAECCNADAVRH